MQSRTAGASFFKLMVWSSSHFGGNLSASSSSNTFKCCWYSFGICLVRAMEVFLLTHAFGHGIMTFPFSQSTWGLKVRSHGYPNIMWSSPRLVSKNRVVCLWCLLWIVILQYHSIRPASLVVPSTLVSWIGCFRGSVWIPSRSVVWWSMKLSIAPLSSKAFSTVDHFAHTVKGTFIFCMLWYKRFGSFALPQVVEVKQFKNPLVQ